MIDNTCRLQPESASLTFITFTQWVLGQIGGGGLPPLMCITALMRIRAPAVSIVLVLLPMACRASITPSYELSTPGMRTGTRRAARHVYTDDGLKVIYPKAMTESSDELSSISSDQK